MKYTRELTPFFDDSDSFLPLDGEPDWASPFALLKERLRSKSASPEVFGCSEESTCERPHAPSLDAGRLLGHICFIYVSIFAHVGRIIGILNSP